MWQPVLDQKRRLRVLHRLRTYRRLRLGYFGVILAARPALTNHHPRTVHQCGRRIQNHLRSRFKTKLHPAFSAVAGRDLDLLLPRQTGLDWTDFDTRDDRGQRLGNLEMELSGLRTNFDGQLTGFRKDIEDRQWRIGELEGEVNNLRADLDTRGRRVGELEQELLGLQSEWDIRGRRISELEGELGSLRTSFDGELNGLRRDHDLRGNRIGELEGLLNDDEYARRRLAGRYVIQDPSLGARYLGGRVRLRGYVTRDIRDEAVSRASAVYGADNVLDSMVTQGITASPEWASRFYEAVPQLREELKDGSLYVEDGNGIITGVVFSQEEYIQAEKDVKRVVGNMKVINRLRVLEKDDLKEIKGVQNVLEKVLHDLGIFTFRQIATWNAEEIEQVRNSLQQFKGRIEREKWIEQSRELHVKKYNQEP